MIINSLNSLNLINSTINQKNKIRNTTAFTATGANIGSTRALTSSPFEGEELKDSFVKQVVVKQVASSENDSKRAKETFDIHEKGKKLADDKGNFTPENAREYLSNFKDYKNSAAKVAFKLTGKHFEPEEAVEQFDTIIGDTSDKDVVKIAEYYHNIYAEDVKYYATLVKSYFDGKKLKDLDENTPDYVRILYNTIKSVLNQTK